MIIGIDLDNTIIDYRNSFWQTALATGILNETVRISDRNNKDFSPLKSEIKNFLLSRKDGHYKWESLQGQVYGRYIHYATIYPGVANFLLHCKRRKVKVYIISHKTEFGHNDKSETPLREVALNFLVQNSLLSGDFGIQSKDVFFFDTRQEKVKKVVELNCDYFIDDLPEVFAEPSFPEHIIKVLFDIRSKQTGDKILDSWEKINEMIFGEIEEKDIAFYVERGVAKKVKTIHKIKGRENSQLYKIKVDSGQKYAGKLYPDPTFDDRNRLLKETKAYKFLHSNGTKMVPEPIWSDKKLNFGLFEWIDGKEINEITDDHINHAAKFVTSLAKLSKHTSFDEFKLASAACISGQMIEDQICNRYKKLYGLLDVNSELNSFLKNRFSQAFEEILSKSKKLWPGKFKTRLTKNHQLLSPSDFGFHNMLLTNEGIKFIDFEYFGWDDPVKLTCDFMLHPGMALTDKHKTLWLLKMKRIFSDDNTFQQRLLASYGLYGLCWSLIMLNIFIKEIQSKKIVSGLKKSDLKQKQARQLKKSSDLLEYLLEVQKNDLPYE